MPTFNLSIQEFTLDGYVQIFSNPIKILRAYAVTFAFSACSSLGSLLVTAMFAYPLSRRDFKYRNVLTFLLFFTTLFNGGIVPNYLDNSKLLHLNNTFWIYVIPNLLNAWNIIVVRTFFQGLPDGLPEAARIDGASELRICFQIMIPLAMPSLASVGFLNFINSWNSWMTTQIYIRDPNLYSLQYILQDILAGEEALKQMALQGEITAGKALKSLETLRFAMAIVASAPMMFVFPFFQKYFAKGMTLGSVKG